MSEENKGQNGRCTKSAQASGSVDCCGGCSAFKYEDVFGFGFCEILDRYKECGEWCQDFRPNV